MAFQCQECGRKFKTVKSAQRAADKGCPKCGGVDIDLGETAKATSSVSTNSKVPSPVEEEVKRPDGTDATDWCEPVTQGINPVTQGINPVTQAQGQCEPTKDEVVVVPKIEDVPTRRLEHPVGWLVEFAVYGQTMKIRRLFQGKVIDEQGCSIEFGDRTYEEYRRSGFTPPNTGPMCAACSD